MDAQKRLEELRRQRLAISQRIAKAERADNSYEHNDHILTGLEAELESIEIQIRELETES